jgi:hypothetical protein
MKTGFGPGAEPGPFLFFASVITRLLLNLHKRLSDTTGRQMSLDFQTKEKIYSRVCELVARKHFDPGMNGANWEELSKGRKNQILRSNSNEEFEKQIQDLLNELKTSHTGFRHSKSPNIPGRHAIAATFMHCNFDGEQRWMFQDVHEGGPAHTAGLRPGDILLQVRNRDLKPPEPPISPVGDDSQYAVQKPGGKRIFGTLNIPSPRSKSHPIIVPKAVLCSQLPDGIGWLYKACHCITCNVNSTAEIPPTLLKIFSYFFLFQSLFIRKGSSRRMSPGGLADPIQPGEPSGIVDGRGTARRTRR